jgi:hypothetical protein
MVWDDVDGLPGNIIYNKSDAIVKQGEDINGFFTYQLTQPVPVDGIFYAGWRQKSNAFLNAGLDLNTPHGDRQLYAVSGIWNQSQVPGSVMIRPVLGAPLTTSINDLFYHKRPGLRFWPNPANDFIMLDPEEIADYRDTYISFFDLQGRELLKVPVSDRINISTLKEGVYIIVSSRNGVPSAYNRLIKTR